MATDVQKRQEQAPEAAESSPGSFEQQEAKALIKAGIANGMAAPEIRELVTLLKETRQWDAEAEFARDMVDFQATCPPIQRIKHNEYVTKDGRKVEYESAPLEEICAVVRAHAQRYGISFHFTAEAVGALMKITCVVRHKNNATPIRSDMPVSTTSNNPGMSDQQKWASAQTFAKRYALINAFGLNLVDVEEPEEPAITPEQVANIEALLAETGADRAKFLQWQAAETVAEMKASRYAQAVAKLEQKRKGGAKP